MLNVNELETELSTSLQDGLNENQVELKRDIFGWNIRTPQRKTHCIGDCLTDYSLWCLTIALIFCIIIAIMIPSIYCIIFTVITFIAILLLIILTWCNRRMLNQQDEELSRHVTVIRKQNKARYRLLIDAVIRKNQSNAPSEVRDLIVDYCCNSPDGHLIDPKELLVGDIVNIKKGEMIPADLRIFECSDDCQVDNSELTGESDLQKRTFEPCDDIPAEATNLLFSGTLLVEGNAKCVCCAIGDSTFMGRTAQLCVAEQYYEPFTRTITRCKRSWSFVLCLVTTVLFIIVYTVNIPDEIFLIWFILTLIIVIFGSFAVGLLWCSRYYFLHQIRNKYNICAEGVSADTLGMMNVLVIGDDELLNEAFLKCYELGINLVIITDKNFESAELMLKEFGIENETCFISYDSLGYEATEYYEAAEYYVRVGWDFNEYENVIVHNTPKEMNSSLFIVASLQHELRFIVGFIGLSMHNRSAFKKADVSIAADKSVNDVVKHAADVACLEEGVEAFKNVMGAIEVSQKFNKYFGWIIGSYH